MAAAAAAVLLDAVPLVVGTEAIVELFFIVECCCEVVDPVKSPLLACVCVDLIPFFGGRRRVKCPCFQPFIKRNSIIVRPGRNNFKRNHY